MRQIAESGSRRFLLWFFDEPANDPYVSLTFDVNVEPALGFLDAFSREHGERVGVGHFITKAVARCLGEIPALNVKIIGRRIYQLDRVDIIMPVHLGATSAGTDETGMMIVHHADRKSLVELARETREMARAERGGEHTTTGSAALRSLAGHVPNAVLHAGLEVARVMLTRPAVYNLVEGRFGVSSAVTNVGAVFAMPEGARFRAGSASIPAKAGHIASVFGVAPTEQAAVIEAGAVAVRRVLPIMMMVDHRAIDGFLMAKTAASLAKAFRDPSCLLA